MGELCFLILCTRTCARDSRGPSTTAAAGAQALPLACPTRDCCTVHLRWPIEVPGQPLVPGTEAGLGPFHVVSHGKHCHDLMTQIATTSLECTSNSPG
jgi:hypothetical protein